MMKKISAALCMLLMAGSISACGGGEGDNNGSSNNGSACADGEIEVPAKINDLNDAGCYADCSGGASCGDDETCRSLSIGDETVEVCIKTDSSTNNTSTNNTSTNNTSTNNTSTNNTSTNNTSTNNTSTNNTSTNNTSTNNTSTNNTSTNNTSTNNTSTNNTSTNNTSTNNTSTGSTIGVACVDSADCGGNICITELPGGYCVANCTTDADCGGDGICLMTEQGGLCVDGCTTAADCREDEGYGCEQIDEEGNTACLPPSEPPVVGIECMDDSVCGGGVCLTEAETGFPGGMCTGGCTSDMDCGGAAADNHCALKGLLQGGGPDDGLCLYGCSTSADCRMGYGCGDIDGDQQSECWPADGTTPVGSACTPPDPMAMPPVEGTDCEGFAGQCLGEADGFTGGYCISIAEADGSCPAGSHGVEGLFQDATACMQDCASDTECRDGYECIDADMDQTLECLPKQPEATGTGVVGDACTAITDCSGGADGFCITEMAQGMATGWTGGYCSLDCTNDPTLCGADATCIQADQTLSICVDNCTATADCRTGYECLDPATGMAPAAGGQGACLPPQMP